MAFAETSIVICGLAQVTILIFIANLIKTKFITSEEQLVEVKTEELKVKIVEVKKEKEKVIKEISKNLVEIEKQQKT